MLAPQPVEFARAFWQQVGPHAAFPDVAPFRHGNADRLSRRCRTWPKILKYREAKFASASAETVGVEQPTILGKLGEDLVAYSDELHAIEVCDQILEERRSIGCVSDFGGHDEGQSPSWLQKASGGDEEWRPGRS